ncbi:MAG: hypothetical protein QNJ53_20560 [Pleurocapsa sp. MO_192.B19]|nr:hypothetical protein [Pleurocapsa sp. MO_192.B19]
MLNQQTLSGFLAWKKVLELTRPVDDSRELWLKLGHNKFIVGNYSPDGHMTAWHTKGSGRNRVRTQLIPDCWEFVSFWAKNNDGGVFFIPTQPQGYPIKEAIAVSDDVAAELDDGTAEEQWQKISEFALISGLEPAYIIHSGSKSYHPHWKATEHLPIEKTIYVRQLTCIALDSDTACANPHQPMRIAGFDRREKGKEQTLEYWSESRYSYDQLIAGIRAYFAAKNIPFPEDISEERWRIYKKGRRDGQIDLSILSLPESELYPKPVYKSTPTVSTTYTGSIPLELALSSSNQSALKGVGSDRNNTGLALARDLIGCHDWLISNGYAVEGDPYDLFINYCYSCTNGGGWNSREWSAIWRSARRGNPAPARRDLTNFVHWYRWSNDSEYQQAARASCQSKNKSVDQRITKEEYDRRFTLPRVIKAFGNKIKSVKKKFNGYGFTKEQLEKQAEIKCQPKYYKKPSRLDVWAKSHQKYTADSSQTGSGKSFDSGRAKPVDFNAEKIIYITNEPRNVTTETLKDGWAVSSGRHDGLVKDQHGKIRRAKGDEGEKIVSTANCMRTETIAALSKKNVASANSAELICGGCPQYGLCKSGIRAKNVPTGYLGARASALASDKIIIHPSSLPSPEHFDYSSVVLLWDEWTTILTNTKQIKVWSSDLKEIILHLTTKTPDLIPSLLPLFTELGKIFDEKAPTRFGWSHGALTERLKPVLPEDLELDALALATEPNLDALNPTKDYGCDIQELPKEVKKLMTEPDHQTAVRVEAETLKQWIVPFLKVLSGGTGYLSKSGGLLTITVPDTRLIDLAHAAKKNIFMDATGHLPDLAANLGVEPSEIEHIAASPNFKGADVKVIQVAGLGRLGQQRGKHQERQTAAITKALQEKHPGIRKIAFKRFASDSDLRWFVESRGANDAEKDTALILEGIPTPNIEALAAEFTCLFGLPPQPGTTKVKYHLELTNAGKPNSGSPYLEINESIEPQFRAFVRRKILAAIRQAVGRLRANKREGEELIIYILGDYPLDLPVELVKAIDITPEAASKIEQTEMAIKGALAQLKSEGQKVTQTAIAKITGYSQGYISRFKKLLLLLLEDINSKSNNSDPPSKEVEWLAKEYFPNLEKAQLPEDIFNLSQDFSARDFLLLFDLLSQRLKRDLIYWLLATQPESVTTQLGSEVLS